MCPITMTPEAASVRGIPQACQTGSSGHMELTKRDLQD